VFWKLNPGVTRELDDGYKRHLEWHRANGDRWTWLGWTLASGDREGYFVDGTFFHAWTDFDTPVSPAADGADVEINVLPHAEVRALGSFEVVPALTDITAERLTAPLPTFCWVTVRPGTEADFESLVAAAVHGSGPTVPHAVLRPVNGITDYLVFLPGDKLSDAPAHAAFLSRLTRLVSERSTRGQIVERVRTEAARFRADMSLIPR